MNERENRRRFIAMIALVLALAALAWALLRVWNTMQDHRRPDPPELPAAAA